MKSSILRKNPLVALLVALSLVLVALASVMVPSATVKAAISDNVTINIPTTAAPVYATGTGAGSVNCNFTLNADNTTANCDFLIEVLRGGVRVSMSSFYAVIYPSLPAGNTTWVYPVPIGSGVSAGYCDIKVSARQPAGDAGASWRTATQTNAVYIDNAAPSTPTLLTPSTGTCTNNNKPTLDWSDVTKASGATIITYDIQIANNSSFTSPTVDTNVASSTYTPVGALADGLWYWKVRARDNAGNTSSWTSPWTFFVDIQTPTNPSTPLPITGHNVPGCYNPTLSWTAGSDPVPSSGLRYWVQVSSTNTFATLAASDNITNVSYTPPGTLGTGTWYWRVRAIDCAGNVHATGWISGDTGQSFTIPPCCTTWNILLGSGWNLVSLPLCPSGLKSKLVSEVLAGLSCTPATCVGIVWGYDPTAGWKYYVPGGTSNTLQTWEVQKGYWIQMTQAATLTVNGSSCPPPPDSLVTNTLYPGWNLIGFKSCSNLASSAYLGGCTASVTYVCGYPGGWNCGASITMEPGKGYWAYLGGTSNCSYGLPCQ